MPSIVQHKSVTGPGDVGVILDAGATAGNLLIAILVASNGTTETPGMTAGGGWTQLGSYRLCRYAVSNSARGAIGVFYKVASGGETHIDREGTSAGMWMVAWELDADISDAVVASLSRQLANTTPVTADLGSLVGDGVAVAAWANSRATDQANNGFAYTPASGWTELIDQSVNPGPFGGFEPWVYYAEAGSVSGSIDPSVGIAATAGGQSIGEWCGFAVLFAATPALECAFSADPLSGLNPLTVDFTDGTTNDPDSWLWDFGDGDTSTDQNPTHVYLEPGIYDVTLTASRSGDDPDECSVTIEGYIRVGSNAWDAYAAADPNGDLLATIQDAAAPVDGATGRSIRVERDGTGSGEFSISRYSPVATESVIGVGNIIKCRFPWRDDYDFAFIQEKGDLTLASANEKGGEEFKLGGRGILAYLDRAVMDAVAYTTGLDTVDKLVELWHTNHVPTPVGVAYRPSDSAYILVGSATKRRIYKVRQSDRKVVAMSPALWSGDDKWMGGLTRDPLDDDILWALEAPWLSGSSANTKIRRISLAGGLGAAHVTNTYDLGAATQLTDIRAATGDLYTSRYDNGHIQRRTRAAPASVAQFWTVTGKTHPNGIAISANGTGTEIAMWFGGTPSGGVSRAQIANLSDPSTVTRTINTKGVAAFGGDWSVESSNDYFYMVSYTLGLVWKYQLTAATPHDPLDGSWRLDEGTPGAILWRIIQEAQSDREDHTQPLPDLTYAFDQTDDSEPHSWDPHDGTTEFDAQVGESVLDVVLRLIPYELVVQMTPYLELVGRNRSRYGVNRTSAIFAAGKVRFLKGSNIIPELGRQTRERPIHSNMLATGQGSLYARAIDADLGYNREGSTSTDLQDATALEGTAEAELAEERTRQDRIRFATPIGDDELNGRYLPFTHYNVGDYVTLHTGAGEHDFTNETFVIYAMSLPESPAGTFEQAVLELGAASIPISRARQVAAALLRQLRSGGGSYTGGGSKTQATTVEAVDSTGATIGSAIGSTIQAIGASVYQAGAGVIGLVIDAASRLLNLDDVAADDITDGQGLAWDATNAQFAPASFPAGIPHQPVYAMPYLLGDEGADGEPGMPGRDGTGGTGGGAALTVEEVDGSPTDGAITKIVFPNGTLGIASHVATYTPVPGPVAMTTVVAELAADFTTASDSAWHDITGLTGISLAPGTWIALVDIENATAAAQYSPAFRLTDGTNTYAQANEFNTYIGTPLGVHTEFVAKPFVLGSTTSLKLQVYSDTVFTIKKYPVRGGDTGIVATKITFLKIDGTAVTPGRTLLEQHTAASSATLDFTTAISSLYDEYEIEFLNVTPATDGAELQMRVSADGGSTWDSTAGRYYHNSSRVNGATWTGYNSGGSATSLGLAHNIANSIAALGASGALRVLPTGANQRWVIGQLHYIPSGADRAMNLVNGDYENGSYNAIRFLFSSGNIASGTIRIYGVAK